MIKHVLILTESGDEHAYAVAEALSRKQVQVTIWHTSDFPTAAVETVLFEDDRQALTVRGPSLDIQDTKFDTVWHRRPCYVVDRNGLLHPADREFTEIECGIFRRSLFHLLAPEAFWINAPEAAARSSRKPVQQYVAREVGLRAPATLYTNDPRQIRSFLARYYDRVVYKPFHGVSWQDENELWAPYTSIITADALVEEDLLQAVPGIYQELVPKAFEIRITVMGKSLFGAKIFSQETETGRLDWRRAYHELRMEAYEVPEDLAERCKRVMGKLGLVFGCFDFIVRPDGEFVFLEVNEMGQFLFVEQYAGLPLLDAFTEFLIQGRPDFEWKPGNAVIRYPQVEEAARDAFLRHVREHAPTPDRSIWEGRSSSAARKRRGVARQ
jgi:hypothetical protein